MEEELMEIIGRYLAEYGEDIFVPDIQNFMVTEDLVASGTAYESLDSYVRGNTLTIEGVDYFEDIDQGIHPGTSVPIEDIRKWIADKGIKARQVPDNILAKRIRDAIRERGTIMRYMIERPDGPAGSRILEKMIEGRGEDVAKFIQDQAGTEVATTITRLIKDKIENG